MKKITAFAFMLMVSFIFADIANAAGWYWLSSDSKYTKEFDPSSVVVTKKKNINGKDVATEIMVWTKTSYSYQGALETIKSYKIDHLITNPNMLSYSLAQVVIDPQERTATYKQEVFYNQKGEPLYTRSNGRVKEINSQEFDEDFYASAVDEVFRMGEMARCRAKDRWITLWTAPVANETITVTADTTTFRLRGNNLIFWEWEEHKNLNNQVVEIRFQKKRINVDSGAEQLVSGKVWTGKSGWQNLTDPYEGRYHSVEKTSPAIKGVERLKAYAKGYSTWVNRYSLTASANNANKENDGSNKDSNANANNNANINQNVKPVINSNTNKGELNANKNTK